MAKVSGELFLDTSYAIALSAPRDQHHAIAVRVATQLSLDKRRLLTTEAILIEIGNALARQRYRADAITLLRSIRRDPSIEVVPLTDDLMAQSFALFETRTDKEWGVTDCVSFTLMRERGVSEALTSDEHFRQAGFRAILLE